MADPSTQSDIIDLIRRIATEYGVDPNLALAVARRESGLNPNAIGDNGHSVGLFQLHDNGMGAGLAQSVRPEERGKPGIDPRTNPETNARTAIFALARTASDHPNLKGGALAAASQRPKDPQDYAVAIDQALQTTQSGTGKPRMDDKNAERLRQKQQAEQDLQTAQQDKQLAEGMLAREQSKKAAGSAQYDPDVEKLAERKVQEHTAEVARLKTKIDSLSVATADSSESGTIREQGSKVWWFPSDGSAPKDVTPQGWQPDSTKTQTLTFGNSVYERQEDGTWKSVLSKQPGADRTPDQARTDAANATTAEANATTATRRAQPGGPLEQGDTLDIRLKTAQTDEAELKTARDKRIQDLSKLVADGTVKPQDALLQLGDFDKYIQNQLAQRRQEQDTAQKALSEYGQYGIASAPFAGNVLQATAPTMGLDAAAKSLGLSGDHPVVRGVQKALSDYYGSTGFAAPDLTLPAPPAVQPQGTPAAFTQVAEDLGPSGQPGMAQNWQIDQVTGARKPVDKPYSILPPAFAS